MCLHITCYFKLDGRYPALEALDRFSTGLKTLALAAGQPGLYHETITWAFLLLIRQRMADAGLPPNTDWVLFSDANPDLLDWKENILKKYYREETLASPQARTVFLFPDKLF